MPTLHHTEPGDTSGPAACGPGIRRRPRPNQPAASLQYSWLLPSYGWWPESSYPDGEVSEKSATTAAGSGCWASREGQNGLFRGSPGTVWLKTGLEPSMEGSRDPKMEIPAQGCAGGAGRRGVRQIRPTQRRVIRVGERIPRGRRGREVSISYRS